MEKLKVFTAFSGYDSQCMALDRLNIDYNLVGWSEIDKYAIQAHNATKTISIHKMIPYDIRGQFTVNHNLMED